MRCAYLDLMGIPFITERVIFGTEYRQMLGRRRYAALPVQQQWITTPWVPQYKVSNLPAVEETRQIVEQQCNMNGHTTPVPGQLNSSDHPMIIIDVDSPQPPSDKSVKSSNKVTPLTVETGSTAASFCKSPSTALSLRKYGSMGNISGIPTLKAIGENHFQQQLSREQLSENQRRQQQQQQKGHPLQLQQLQQQQPLQQCQQRLEQQQLLLLLQQQRQQQPPQQQQHQPSLLSTVHNL